MGAGAERSPDDGPVVPDEASNVLLVAPAMTPPERDACVDLLLPDPPEELSVLGVSLTKAPERWLAEYESLAGGAPADLALIGAGDTRSADPRDDADGIAEGASIETVPTGDLAELGVAITDHLAAHLEDDGRGRLALCLNSVSALLEGATREATFEFLHLLTGQVRAADGIAHYHVDRGTCDEETLALLEPLFDAVVEIEG